MQCSPDVGSVLCLGAENSASLAEQLVAARYLQHSNIILDYTNPDCSLIMVFNTASWRHQCIIKELLSILRVGQEYKNVLSDTLSVPQIFLPQLLFLQLFFCND